ncbi:family transcriptional regulator, putative [Babesia ovata]|uniref:Family transcriptional regulator, putative n=1 Tax=Babesia ovata TaxID=189622 RepID=A0A2H6KE51_9APIC|nr:family transcriptional regulator, putative [Babesia ovata]GBE61272.1 family transcriptional regulator, putative [Babesia ovata]
MRTNSISKFVRDMRQPKSVSCEIRQREEPAIEAQELQDAHVQLLSQHGRFQRKHMEHLEHVVEEALPEFLAPAVGDVVQRKRLHVFDGAVQIFQRSVYRHAPQVLQVPE